MRSRGLGAGVRVGAAAGTAQDGRGARRENVLEEEQEVEGQRPNKS